MQILVVLSVVGACFAGELFDIKPLEQCEDSTSIKHVQVENCNDPTLCRLMKGANTTLRVVMVAPKKVTNVKALVTGTVGDAELPFPGFDRYVCKHPDNKNFCPQEPGKEYTLNLSLPILNLFPKIKTTAFVRLIDDDAPSEIEERLGCFKIMVELIDNPNAPVTKRPDDDDEEE
ncbi:NPC intracellular cholesterol transporter 2 [Galendromus occidentalis]|uniref:NPC intracellular cholesterol transporter 2 n=1 Tax=Galendromus occidentalis TaxID=34638 RepID=A0AAJ6QX07_9ACAR|nr:NPC intracellular cholesterol transporter 2 [Galendromus occidentalis]